MNNNEMNLYYIRIELVLIIIYWYKIYIYSSNESNVSNCHSIDGTCKLEIIIPSIAAFKQ